MTPAMLERARQNAARGGYANVEFREGRLESLPLGDAVVDAVTSNCVINLVPDKAAVFRQVARVLKPGGRLVVSDIVLDGRLPEALEQDLYAYVGCVSGAVDRRDYFEMLEAAGLGPVEVLKDVDYLAATFDSVPEEVQAILDRTGIRPEDVAGKVRSITYRAYRRSPRTPGPARGAAAAGSSISQCAVIGWPGHTGQVSFAAFPQTVTTKSSLGASGPENSSQPLLRRPTVGC